MQPKFEMKKTLLASALILGLGNAFHASSETFNVSAGAIADVSVDPVAGFTELNFGTGIKGQAIGSTCTMQAKSVVLDSTLLLDQNWDGTDDGDDNWAIGGTACEAADSSDGISAYMLEIDGADTATVQVSIPNLVETGYTWVPGAESCVTVFSGASDDDTDECTDFDGLNTISGVKMAVADENNDAADEYTAIAGKARLLLGGQLTITGAGVANGTPVAGNITVQVTYE
ncbi:MAG: hypothetical protein HWE10_03480 [Gammaproteobacteria bacterium]|nr:hypothetical protein [Gammaproteobacteria bacterium]